MIGKTILHYKILSKLGEGGMGVVYKAEDTDLKREVAIKFLPRQVAASEEERERFKIEAQAAAALNHTNIATIHAIEKTDEETFIVMEYIKGHELKERIDAGPLPIDDALDIAFQIAQGLQVAHEAKVIHRDIKSSNIMLADRGEVKIMDFGLAKRGGQTKLTKEGMTLGTVAYMSPEQTRGEEVDHRSDLFSLGVLLYEMLAGQMPFKGDYEQAVIYSILNEDPQGIAQASGRSDVPAPLEALILKCLEKSPQARYQSATELIDVLQQLRTGSGRQAGITSKTRASASRRIPRKNALILAGLAFAVLLLILLSPYFSPDHRQESIIKPSPSRIAVFPFSVRGGEDFAYLSEGMVDLVSTKLNGAGDLRSVDARTLLNYLGQEENGIVDPARGRSISNRFGAGRYVLGDILEASGQLHINASLYDINQDDEAAAQATVAGRTNQIFELVDDLTGQLLAAQDVIDEERITSVALLTTPSFPALKAYLNGEKEMRLGRPNEAILAYKQAIAADDSFALAYYRLSYAAGWVEDYDLLFNSLEGALRFKNRMAEADRLQLEANASSWDGDFAASERDYLDVVRRFPEAFDAWHWLGEIANHYNPFRGRTVKESEEAFERALALSPNHPGAMLHLIEIKSRKDEFASLDSLINHIVQLSPDGAFTLAFRALQAFATGNTGDQDQILKQLRQASDDEVWWANLFVSVDARHFSGGSRIARLLTDPTRSKKMQVHGHLSAALAALSGGRLSAAERELEAAAIGDPILAQEYRVLFAMLPFVPTTRDELMAFRTALEQTDTPWSSPGPVPRRKAPHDGLHPLIHQYLLGCLSARLDESEAALAFANKIEGMQVPRVAGSLAKDLAQSLRARVAMVSGNSEKALLELEQAPMRVIYPFMFSSPLFSHSDDRFLRGELLHALGRPEEALRWYETVAELAVYDLIYLAPAHLRQGEIYEKMGQPETAVEHYERFLALWQNADGDLPFLMNAKERLVALKGE